MSGSGNLVFGSRMTSPILWQKSQVIPSAASPVKFSGRVLRIDNASRPFDGQVGMAAQPAAVQAVGHFGCHGGMTGGAVASPVRCIQPKARAVVGLARVGRQGRAIASPLYWLALPPVHVRPGVDRDKPLVLSRLGVSISLPLFVFPVTQAATGGSFHPFK